MSVHIPARAEDLPELAGIGERILARRHLLGMSRRDLVRHTGLGEAHLLNIERGLRIPGAGSLVRLHRALGCSVDYLLGLTDSPSLRS